MKRFLAILVLLNILLPFNVLAGRGCCSHHGGVSGCGSNGRQICNDGTYSPTCTCTPAVRTIKQETVYGCTDSKANNYDSKANKDDGSCTYDIYGCTDSKANNYDSDANKDDGSCTYDIYGCTDSEANNYDSDANKDDGSCTYDVYGCMDSKAINYNSKANKDDGTCVFKNDTKSKRDQNENEEPEDIVGTVVFLIATGSGAYYLIKKKNKKSLV